MILCNFFLLLVPMIFSNMHDDFSQKWYRQGVDSQKNILRLLNILSLSSRGKRLISLGEKKALKMGGRLQKFIEAGEISHTHTRVYREFSPSKPEHMILSTYSTISIERDLSLKDAIVDLAHELTHFSSRTFLNPYEKNFNFKIFIRSILEMRGGEVDAYFNECLISEEILLFDLDCSHVKDPVTGRLSKKKIVKEFYKIGKHYENFNFTLKGYQFDLKDFPHLSRKRSSFISSLHSLPYPLAISKEFEIIMKQICSNLFKRLKFLKTQNSHLEKQYFKQCQ